MKLNHKIPVKAIQAAQAKRTDEEMDERYIAELESARSRALKAWKSAQRRLRTAERKIQNDPSAKREAHRERLRAEVIARLEELKRFESLMKSKTRGDNWSGKGSVRAVNKGGTL